METPGCWRCQEHGLSGKESCRLQAQTGQERSVGCYQQDCKERAAQACWSSHHTSTGPRYQTWSPQDSMLACKILVLIWSPLFYAPIPPFWREYLPCVIVFWKYAIFYFTGARSYEFVLSLRGDFEVGLLNNVGTVNSRGTLGDDWMQFAFWDGHVPFGSEGWNVSGLSRCVWVSSWRGELVMVNFFFGGTGILNSELHAG
jgi:prepilin-type processing-associated H-X9-DG protein